MENGPEKIVTWLASIFGENPSWDLLLLMAIVGVVLALSFWGRSKIISVIVASYIAMVLLSVTPLLGWMQNALNVSDSLVGIAISCVIIVAAMFAVVEYGIGSILSGEDGDFAKSVILAVSSVGMLTSFMFSIVTNGELSGFSPITITLFVGDITFGAWILAPMLMIRLSDS